MKDGLRPYPSYLNVIFQPSSVTSRVLSSEGAADRIVVVGLPTARSGIEGCPRDACRRNPRPFTKAIPGDKLPYFHLNETSHQPRRRTVSHRRASIRRRAPPGYPSAPDRAVGSPVRHRGVPPRCLSTRPASVHQGHIGRRIDRMFI